MPESNLMRVTAWLAEEERRKKAEPEPIEADKADRYFTHTPKGVQSYMATPGSLMTGGEVEDPTGAEARYLQESGFRWLPEEQYGLSLAQARVAADGGGRAPPGKLPFISGTPTHAPSKPAFSYIPPRKPNMEEAIAGAAELARPVANPAAPAPAAKPTPRAILAKAKRSSDVSTRTMASAAEPAMSSPERMFDNRLTGPSLSPRVSSFLHGRRKSSGLEEAQRRTNLNQLSANLGQSAEFLASGVGGVRPRTDLYANLQAQAEQPVEQYRQRYDEQRQQEQDDAALAEAEREATRAAEQMAFQRERAVAQDQLARDRLAQEEAALQARLRSEAADRGLRREEMAFRQKEGQELKQQMAQDKERALRERQDERDQMELAKRLQAAADAKPDLDLVMRYATSSEGEDIPGIGWGISGLPGAMVSQEGSDLRQAAIRLYRAKTRIESGQTVTPQEAATALEARGMGTWKTEGQWRAGMKALAGETAAAMRNIESGFNPSVVATRRERGGITSADIPTAPILMQSPDGQQYEVDQAEALEAQRNGWRRIR